MDQYRAIRLERFAQDFRSATEIIELPFTAPGPGEIAVRNRFCGVNALFDTQLARNDVHYVKVALPSIAGVEAVGVVEAVGEGVTGFAVGDAVATLRFGGGYREANVAPADRFVTVPAATRDYLALASTGVSAFLVLNHAAQLKDGETIAVAAAAGGMGHLIVQLAKLRGCHVIAICGGSEKTDFLKSLGADRVIDYRAESVAEVLAVEYRDRLDVAIDTVGADIFEAFADNLAPHGRLVVSGIAAETDHANSTTGAGINLRMYYKAASIRCFMNGLVTELWPEARRQMFALYQSGKIRVTFDSARFHGLASVYDAVERLLSGQSMGKVSVDLSRP